MDPVDTDLSTSIADRILTLRREARLTRNALANRCHAQGHHVHHATILTTETGQYRKGEIRRRHATITDITHLARALGTTPAHLALPLGEADTVTVAGTSIDTAQALAWWRGHTTFPGDPAPDPGRSMIRNGVALQDRHDAILYRITTNGPGQTTPTFGALSSQLREVRDRMRSLHYLPPRLPAELAHLDAR